MKHNLKFNMKGPFSYIVVFGILTFFSFLSCVDNDDSKSVKISFTSIVGKYNGESKICSSPSMTADTICSPFEENVLNVTIFDVASIQVDDSKDYFFKTKLIHQSSPIENGQQLHLFAGQVPAFDFMLIYNETKRSILLSTKSLDTDILMYNIFEGQR